MPDKEAIKIKIKKLDERAALPEFGSDYAAGADLRVLCDEDIVISPHETIMLHTGLSAEIPEGFAGFIYARSGLAAKRGLAPANKVGVIDSDYRGEIMVALHNHTDEPAYVSANERIAQMVVMKVPAVEYEEAAELADTVRGEGGFGSTGRG